MKEIDYYVAKFFYYNTVYKLTVYHTLKKK